MSLFARVDESSPIYQNPSSDANIGDTRGGSDWLWAVFAIMLVSDLVFIGWHFTLPVGKRLFHQLPILILTTASIAYFSLASNLGQTGVSTEFHESGARTIWYVRYIDWVITTPLLLLELLLGTGLPLSDIVTTIFFDIAMIVTGLVGALVASQYKFGYFVMGCFCEFYIWWVLLGPARNTAGLLGADVKKAFTGSALLLSFLWLLYPIAWGVADGGNVINVPGEMVFYGVLDVLAKPVFCFFHVFAISRIPFESFNLSGNSAYADGNNGAVGNRGSTDKSRLAAGHSQPATAQNTTTTTHEPAPQV